MTKPLSKEEKKKRKQQKAASKTVKTIIQPKHTDQEAEPVNLCDDCAYEFGECEGKPKFASDQDETLTGPEADRVIECPAFVNVAAMPTAQEAAAPGPAAAGPEEQKEPEPPAEAYNCPPDCRFSIPSGGPMNNPDIGGCAVEDKIPPESRYETDPLLPVCPEYQVTTDQVTTTSEEEPEVKVIRTDLPERPDPKRFLAEEDFGICQSCERPLKRTAFNRYQDTIRCTNARCRAYRAIVKTISTGVK